LAGVRTLEQFCHSCSTDSSIDLAQTWWYELLVQLAGVWQSDFYAVRSISCQLLAHIPKTVFEELPVMEINEGQDEEFNLEYMLHLRSGRTY
jgi:hypothetical protein